MRQTAMLRSRISDLSSLQFAVFCLFFGKTTRYTDVFSVNGLRKAAKFVLFYNTRIDLKFKKLKYNC
jgi:hypothetical protein